MKWQAHPDHPGVFVLVDDTGREVGWIERETERCPALHGPHRATGRWVFGDGRSKGVRSSKALAKRAVERMTSNT